MSEDQGASSLRADRAVVNGAGQAVSALRASVPSADDQEPRSLADDLLKGATEAAKYLGLGRSQVYRMTAAGELPCVRMGSLIFYRKSGLDRAFCGSSRPDRTVRPADRPLPEGHPEGCCTYAEIVPLFVDLYEPDPTRFHTLGARLRQLIKVAGMGKVTTRGAKAFYSPADVRRLLVLMELNHIGISQLRAVELLEGWQQSLTEILFVTVPVGPRNDTITIDMGALRDAARKHLPQLFYAQAIEARRAETGTGSVEDESAVAESHAPESQP